MRDLSWKTGFEIELLAPAGKSRRDLALAIRDQLNLQQNDGSASVSRIFYPQSEPSKVDGTPVFENLVLGFEVRDGKGDLVATCVDDLTIRRDLFREATSEKDWYRIISDDKRLLNLVAAQCDPEASQSEVLKPLAELFKTPLEELAPDLFHVRDRANASIAMAPSLPGERHRPCELISPPLKKGQLDWLESTLHCAEKLNFTVPIEAAVHIHFDAERLRDSKAFMRLVKVLFLHGGKLRELVETNVNCTRLGELPEELFQLLERYEPAETNWNDLRENLAQIKLTKFCDFNLMNVVLDVPGKQTFEARIFPGAKSPQLIFDWAELFVAILTWCTDKGEEVPAPDFRQFLGQLPLGSEEVKRWENKLTN